MTPSLRGQNNYSTSPSPLDPTAFQSAFQGWGLVLQLRPHLHPLVQRLRRPGLVPHQAKRVFVKRPVYRAAVVPIFLVTAREMTQSSAALILTRRRPLQVRAPRPQLVSLLERQASAKARARRALVEIIFLAIVQGMIPLNAALMLRPLPPAQPVHHLVRLVYARRLPRHVLVEATSAATVQEITVSNAVPMLQPLRRLQLGAAGAR